jgi:hypothetical protein
MSIANGNDGLMNSTYRYSNSVKFYDGRTGGYRNG